MTGWRLGRYVWALGMLCAAAVAQVGPLEIRSLRPPSGSGYETTFQLTVADGKDGSSVSTVGIYIGTESPAGLDPERTRARATPGGTSGCMAYWDRNADAFFLADAQGW